MFLYIQSAPLRNSQYKNLGQGLHLFRLWQGKNWLLLFLTIIPIIKATSVKHLLRARHGAKGFTPQLCEVGIINTLILQKRKWKFKKSTWLAQRHTVGVWQRQNSNLSLKTPKKQALG